MASDTASSTKQAKGTKEITPYLVALLSQRLPKPVAKLVSTFSGVDFCPICRIVHDDPKTQPSYCSCGGPICEKAYQDIWYCSDCGGVFHYECEQPNEYDWECMSGGVGQCTYCTRGWSCGNIMSVDDGNQYCEDCWERRKEKDGGSICESCHASCHSTHTGYKRVCLRKLQGEGCYYCDNGKNCWKRETVEKEYCDECWEQTSAEGERPDDDNDDDEEEDEEEEEEEEEG